MDEARDVVPLGEGDRMIADGLALLRSRMGKPQGARRHAQAFHR